MRLDGSEKRRLMTLSVQPGLSVAFPGLGIGWKRGLVHGGSGQMNAWNGNERRR